MQNLKNQFNQIQNLRIFEVEVINKNTNENDFIIFDIQLIKNSLIAQHESLTIKQSKSKKIAFVKLALNNSFSLDENLQNLYEDCINSILESDYFTLSN